jgi:hypothetical protein
VVGSKMTWNMAGCRSVRPVGRGTRLRPASQRRVVDPRSANGAASRSSLHVAAT